MSFIAGFEEWISIIKNMAWGTGAAYHAPEYCVHTEKQIGP